MNSNIGITAYQSISATTDFFDNSTNIQKLKLNDKSVWAGKLNTKTEIKLKNFLAKNEYYQKLDRSVQLALFLADNLNINSKLKTGVNIGSSRGATEILEKDFEYFLANKNTPVLTSPTSSLGNISSWVGQHLNIDGLAFSHSMTCSTALISLLNALAWIQSGMTKQMIFGGSEAPLTPFTIAQIKAMRIYSNEKDIPCLAGLPNKTRNTMVLGEGSALFVLEKNPKNSLAYIKGVGYASESIKHATEISKKGFHFQKSMKAALEMANLETVDIVISHTPGTIKGDNSELFAIEQVFNENIPFITNNKWKIGHTFGASGGLSLALALEMINKQEAALNPIFKGKNHPKKIETVMINSAGFGGNSVSIVLSKP